MAMTVTVASDPIAFLHDLSWEALPRPVQHASVRCLVDLAASLTAGRRTPMSALARDHAAMVFGGDQATLPLDGRRVSAPGAALATGMTIDSFDIHDSHRESLGHAGVHVFAATLAIFELRRSRGGPLPDGQEFLATLTAGYEIGCRAGRALHGTTSDYHTSGAWGAVSSAGLYSRVIGLDRERTREALGIAEYHGPRSQMMRCIDHPTMVKDGSGWGAMAGVSAGMLAEAGFTGAPAVTVESDATRPWWTSLGGEWEILAQGFKAHGSCWWAQPAIEAALTLARTNRLRLADIREIRVETFEKAVHLSEASPTTTEQAQYSLPFPVAAALVKGSRPLDGWYGLGPDDLLDPDTADTETRRLAASIQLVDAPDLTAAFPNRFLARVTVRLFDGTTLASPDTTFRGELDDPFDDDELSTKARWLMEPVLDHDRAERLLADAWSMADAPSIEPFLELLSGPPDRIR
jgi:2-methylcitrate dehydratase PrpD